MARLFGLIGNRPDLCGRVFASEAEAFRARSRSAAGTHNPLGWGVGFYQGGEVLMRRRPIDDRPEIDIAKVASDVRADMLIGHVRSATVGALRTENTHPFRYRQWLFAQTGTIPNFEQARERLVGSVPEFLRSGIRGETDSEVLFHVFLSFLHDAGRLNDAIVEEACAKDAMRSTLAVADAMTAEVGGQPSEINAVITNGEYIVSVHRNPHSAMAFRTYAGKSDADYLIGDDHQLRRKTPELAHMHFTLLASDFDEAVPARWKAVSQNAIVTLTRGNDPHVEAI